MNTDREIYEEMKSELLKVADVLGGRHDAPDVVSTIITRTLSRRGTLAGLENPKKYLMKAVSHESESVRRKRIGALERSDVVVPHLVGRSHRFSRRSDPGLPLRSK